MSLVERIPNSVPPSIKSYSRQTIAALLEIGVQNRLFVTPIPKNEHTSQSLRGWRGVQLPGWWSGLDNLLALAECGSARDSARLGCCLFYT